MASTQFAVLSIFALLLPSIALATQHIVGDEQGWTTNFDYQAWAASKVFRVGDSLLFKYTAPNHNVIRANQTEFQQCIKSEANQVLTTGSDIIDLKSLGKKWYICGVKDHCSNLKMKLAINVIDAWAPAPAPTTPAPPPPTSSAFSIKASSVSQILSTVGLAAIVTLAAF
ncbi:mavicyanin-like [Punica granatum]|uniref:Mavicyanin-like n=1 Tax=Punica granatum TaxID=22663 RepID=A0A6P8D9U0_PUNGR|nr:mavicyanin-like [Punica granatum]